MVRAALIALLSSSLFAVVAVGCRNDIVGPPPRTDAGFEGEGEGGEGEGGEGEGESCDDDVPAVSVRVADDDGFVYCGAGATVKLTLEGGSPEVATQVTLDNGECRHQGGFGVPGRYAVDIVVDGFAPQSLSLNAPTSNDGCNNPITASASVTVVAN